MLVGLLVDGLNVVEERKVLVLLLHEHCHESVQVVDVGHRFNLLERFLVPLLFVCFCFCFCRQVRAKDGDVAWFDLSC